MLPVQKLDPVKILLVDDLANNLLALEGVLRRSDVEILQARSGTGALDLMIMHEFAVALIDVQMPGMSGFELAELMRGTNRTKHVPIIFVTATAKEQSFAFKGYESGAVDFLLKPLDAHAVKSKVNIFVEQFQQKALLRQTQAELEQSVQTRDDFMSIASHELKTPLTALKLQSQLRQRYLEKTGLTTFTAERLAHMFKADERQLNRLHQLIDDMLDISRITTGKLMLSMENLDVSELVREVVEGHRELLSAADCAVELSIEGPLAGRWDRFRLEQVVTNLLTNAMRYGAGQKVVVRAWRRDARACFSVGNLGRGIAPENHARIFQRFERVKGSESGGLGLGLFIVSQILEAHQGSIRVESALGQGAIFTVELPIS